MDLNFFKVNNGLKVFGRADIDSTVTSMDVLPVTGNTYSIGSSGNSWKKGYFSEYGIDFDDNTLDVQNAIQDSKWLFFNDKELATYSTVLDISASLANQIQNIDVTSQLAALSGDLYSLIAETSGNLQDQITAIGSISGDWARLSGENVFTGTLNTFNNTVEVFDDLVVHGTFTVAGSAFIVDKEHVRTADNKITINYGETSPTGVTSITAGIEVDRGPNNDPYYFVFDEFGDYFRIGTANSLQAVATRQDTPINRGLAYWNSSNDIFLTDFSTTIDTVTGAFLDISNNRSEVIAVSGNLYTLIYTISGNLQSEITSLNTSLTGSYLSLNQTVPQTISGGAPIFAGGIKTTNPGSSQQAQFGDSIPFYVINNWPTLGFNAYYDSGWRYGAGSVSKYGAYQSIDPSTGQMDYYFSPSSGNAGDLFTGSRKLTIYVDGRIQAPSLGNAGNEIVTVNSSGTLLNSGTTISTITGNCYSLIASTSGFLQSEIVALSAMTTTLSAEISGLQNHFVNAEVLGISASWAKISCVPILSTDKVVWELTAIDDADISHRYSSTVAAIHNGSSGISWTEYAILYAGNETSLQVRVTNDGTDMCLEVSE